jgi:hypothetical protein
LAEVWELDLYGVIISVDEKNGPRITQKDTNKNTSNSGIQVLNDYSFED